MKKVWTHTNHLKWHLRFLLWFKRPVVGVGLGDNNEWETLIVGKMLFNTFYIIEERVRAKKF